MKKIILVTLSLFLINNVNAFDIRSINKSKIVSQASYNVNDTNLIDSENAENILNDVTGLNQALSEKEKEIQEQSK